MPKETFSHSAAQGPFFTVGKLKHFFFVDFQPFSMGAERGEGVVEGGGEANSFLLAKTSFKMGHK